MSAGEALDLDFIESAGAARHTEARRRRLLALGVSVLITGAWLAYVTVSGQWPRVVDRWASAVTMTFGSFIAGSTPQGGGAVAFPVFTKGLDVPPEVARSFALAIQTIGMGAATLAIIISRRRVIWKAVWIGVPAASVTFLAAALLLGDSGEPFRPSVIPGPYVKVSFTLVVGAMALMTYLGSRVRVREVNVGLPTANRRTYAALVSVAAVGGLAAALTGSGADVFIYVYLGILLAVDPRVGVPTSVVVMAGVSIVGFLVLGIADGHLATMLSGDGSVLATVGGEAVATTAGGALAFGSGTVVEAGRADLFGMWLAAVPVVAWGAPLGSWVAARLSSRQLVRFVVLLAAAEIITTAVFLEELRSNPALLAFAFIGGGVLAGGLYWVAKHRQRFFDLPGTDVGRSLTREHLDVASDYTEVLGSDPEEGH